jgi:hypothetical protein
MAGDLLRFVVHFPEGELTLLPKRAPLGNSAPIRGRTLAVLALASTAWDAARAQLPDDAQALHASILPGEQPAIAVIDLTEDVAMSLGRTLGLGEILFWDGRRGRMVGCC